MTCSRNLPKWCLRGDARFGLTNGFTIRAASVDRKPLSPKLSLCPLMESRYCRGAIRARAELWRSAACAADRRVRIVTKPQRFRARDPSEQPWRRGGERALLPGSMGESGGIATPPQQESYAWLENEGGSQSRPYRTPSFGGKGLWPQSLSSPPRKSIAGYIPHCFTPLGITTERCGTSPSTSIAPQRRLCRRGKRKHDHRLRGLR